MIDELVVSLDTAKKLKAAGWIKPTAHCWSMSNISNGEYRVYVSAHLANDINAPTAEEILVELPIQRIDDGDTPLELAISRCRTYWYVAYLVSEEVAPYETEFHDVSLSEAAAQMWLWCKKEGYIK